MDENTLANVHILFAQTIPFNRFLGMEVDHLETGLARLRLPFRPELIGDPMRPALHGGVISALLDTTGGLAVWSRLTLQDRISTVDLRVDYLLPGRAELLLAEARVRRLGNHLGVAALRAWHPDQPDESVAEGMAVYNIRRHHGG
ncbi:MAG: hotdog fold thioesterase [Deltaproteobacteria bacterium]|nr:hotdog fold thioesterase [Deltaproteobacteria bacterium]